MTKDEAQKLSNRIRLEAEAILCMVYPVMTRTGPIANRYWRVDGNLKSNGEVVRFKSEMAYERFLKTGFPPKGF